MKKCIGILSKEERNQVCSNLKDLYFKLKDRVANNSVLNNMEYSRLSSKYNNEIEKMKDDIKKTLVDTISINKIIIRQYKSVESELINLINEIKTDIIKEKQSILAILHKFGKLIEYIKTCSEYLKSKNHSIDNLKGSNLDLKNQINYMNQPNDELINEKQKQLNNENIDLRNTIQQLNENKNKSK